MPQSFKLGFNSTWTENFQIYKLNLEMTEEPDIKLPKSIWLQKKQENSRKRSPFASWTTLKPLTVWITENCGKFLKRWEYQATLPASWKTCMQVKKKQLGPDKEQWTGSKLGKEYVNAAYCHLAYLTYMQNKYISEILDWRKYKLELRLEGEISVISDIHMIPPLWQKVKRN